MSIVESNLMALGRVAGPVCYPPISAAPYPPDEALPEFPGLTVGDAPESGVCAGAGCCGTWGWMPAVSARRSGIRWASW
jgi:hypothetical protein